jgi:hypothetical protein
MKKRLGFVSNSSSSSFIITSQLNKQKIEDGKLTMTLTIPIDHSIIDQVITTKEELYDYYEDYYCETIDEMKSDRHYKDELEQLKELEMLITHGFSVVVGQCSNEDDGISPYLYRNGFDKVVIHYGDLYDSEG